MKRLMTAWARSGIILVSLLVPLSLWAQTDIESVYLVDISSSMLELYGSGDRNLLKDVICYIKNNVESLPDDHSSVTLIVFAARVNTIRWDPVNSRIKTDIYRYLDRLADSTMNAWKNNPESLSSTYISRAVLAAYASLQHNPNRWRQNLHLFSDGELLIPPDDPQPLDYPNMMQQLESYHINAHDLRFFYYFPLLISANRYLQELVNREGGEIREHYEADLCTQSVTLYHDYRILLSVKDHHLHPFPAVTI
nr:VWA domain-containing protein [Candidatus Delongbacteria bacterium]